MIKDAARHQQESERLRELIQEIGLPLRKLPEIISADHEDCLAWWTRNDDKIIITDKHFSRLTSLLGIEESKLLQGNYDRDLVRRRIHGDFQSLPERYEGTKNSYLRSSAHIIKYLRLTRGQLFTDQLLSSLNLSPLVYENTNLQINLTYFSDLLKALADRGFSQTELDALSSVIFLSLQQTTLGQKFQEAESGSDIYTTLARNFDYFDTNFEYKSSFVGKKYFLKTTLPLNQHKALSENPKDLERLLRYRHILLAWFPYLAGLSPIFPKAEIVTTSDSVEISYEFVLGNEAKKQPTLVLV